jgi:16S rRNA (cytosine967-C5)-methyltransferase
MDEVADLVRAGGTLAYATCSMLNAENGDQVRAFMDRHPGAWRLAQDRAFTPLDGGDGFYVAILTKN